VALFKYLLQQGEIEDLGLRGIREFEPSELFIDQRLNRWVH